LINGTKQTLESEKCIELPEKTDEEYQAN
jgi:hypothetical protein